MVDAPITKEGRDAERTRMKPGRKKREPIGQARNFETGGVEYNCQESSIRSSLTKFDSNVVFCFVNI